MRSAIPIPANMRHLKMDPRGYPIPAGVLIDIDGKAHFTVNDEETRQHHIKQDKCSICGKPLLKVRWSVGGPGSAFMDHGAYIDPPMHESCMKYALQVCPYLAVRKYGRLLDDRLLDANKIPGILIAADETMIPERPPVFVAVMHVGQDYVMEGRFYRYIRPKRPYRKVEYWQYGRQLPESEGKALADAAMAQLEGMY